LEGSAAAGSGGIPTFGLNGPGKVELPIRGLKMVMQGLRQWIGFVCDGAVCPLDGWVVFHFERTSPFRMLRVIEFHGGSIGGRRGSSKLEALTWEGNTDLVGRPEQLEKKDEDKG
jgi:hypothetical protein